MDEAHADLCQWDEMMLTIRARIKAIKAGDSDAAKKHFQPKWRDLIHKDIKTRTPGYQQMKAALKKLYYTDKLFEG